MKNYFFPLALLLLTFGGAKAQTPIWKSADTASRSGNITVAEYVYDTKGNHYYVGHFSGTAKFGKYSFTATTNDAYALKLNNKGTVAWAKHYTGKFQVLGTGIAADTAGNVYVTGSFSSDVVIDSDTTSSTGSNDGFLVKYDKNGKVQWSRFATGGSVQNPKNVTLDQDGAIYWSGDFLSTSKIANKSISAAGFSYDCYLAKFMPSGHLSWVKTYGGSSVDQVIDVAHDGDKSLLVTGQFFGSMSFDSKNISGSGSYDIFIARCDSTGKFNWALAAGGTSVDAPTAISWDKSGGFLIAGNFTSSASIGGKNLSGGNNDMFVAHLNKSLKAIYANPIKRSGTTFGTNTITGIELDADGGAVFCGFINGAISFKSKTYTPSATDIFVARTTDKGAHDWINIASGNNVDNVANIYLDGSGYYFIGGAFINSCDFGNITLTGNGNVTIYFASGLPPVTPPNFKGKKSIFVYADSTLSKSFDLKIKSETIYKFLSGPAGLTYDSATVSITWTPDTNNYGRSKVFISAENIGGADTAEINIWVIRPPKVKILSPDTLCLGEEINISYDKKDFGPINGIWEFSNGASFVRDSIDYTFKDTGTYVISLSIENFFGDIDSGFKIIKVLPLPSINIKQVNACVKDSLQLLDSSKAGVGTIVSRAWYINDTLVSNAQSFKKYYASAKSLGVKIKVTSNTGCNDSLSKTVRITEKPKAKFVAFNACEKAEALFFDQSTTDSDTITQYDWNFGDGTTTSVSYSGFAHSYTKSGKFNVSLKVTTGNNCSDKFTSPITVYPTPIPKFNVKDLCGDVAIDLVDNSDPVSGTIATRIWNFGDGKFSSKKNVTHKYTKTGTFNIALIVSNTQGCGDTLEQAIQVYPSPKPEIAIGNKCANAFTKLSGSAKVGATDSITTLNWSIDGVSQKNDPTIRYQFSDTTKTYRVVLGIETKAGCADSSIKLIKSNPFVSSQFTIDTACIGDTMIIDGDLKKPNLDSVFWIGWNVETIQKNGNWHAIFNPGNGHQLFLRTFSTNRCQDSSYTALNTYIQPSSDFRFEYVGGKQMKFLAIDNSGVDYKWTFGDGNVGISDSVNHTYASTGKFTVTLSVTNSNGCVTSTSKEIETSFSIGFDNQEKLEISLYPNPAKSIVNLLVVGNEEAKLWHVFDMNGKSIAHGQFVDQTLIDLSQLPKGLYNLRVQGKNTITFKSLIIE